MNGRALNPIDGPLLRAYNNLKLHCPMHCEWSGSLGDLEVHFKYCINAVQPAPSAPPQEDSPLLPMPIPEDLTLPSTFSYPPLESPPPLSPTAPPLAAYDDPLLFPPPTKEHTPAPTIKTSEPPKQTSPAFNLKKPSSSKSTSSSTTSTTSSTSTTTMSTTTSPAPTPAKIHPDKGKAIVTIKSATIYTEGNFNPYVVVRKSGPAGLFGHIARTEPCTNTKNPVWNFSKQVSVKDVTKPQKQWGIHIVVELWDKKPFPEKDEMIGRCVQPTSIRSRMEMKDFYNEKMINAYLDIDVRE